MGLKKQLKKYSAHEKKVLDARLYKKLKLKAYKSLTKRKNPINRDSIKKQLGKFNKKNFVLAIGNPYKIKL